VKARFLASLALGVAMVAASALTGALTPSPKAVQAQAAFSLEAMIPASFGPWRIDPHIVPLRPNPEQQGVIERIYDQTLSRTYVNAAGRRVMLSIAYGGDQSKALQLHLPEVCYVAQGFQLVRDGSDRLGTAYGVLPVQRLVARQQERNEPITYWITIGEHTTRSGIEQKLRRLAYGLSGEIPDGMLVRVSSIANDEPAAWRLQDRFIADLLAALDGAGRVRLIGTSSSRATETAMPDIVLQGLFASLPFVVVVLLAVVAVLAAGLGLVWPRLLVYPYLCAFFWITSTNYGSLAVFVTPGFYSRGSGLLLFPLVLWMMLGAWCCARVATAFRHGPAPACSVVPWFWGWAALLAAHLGAAVLAGVPLKDALAPSGFSNIVWMGPLIGLMLLAFRTREEAVELAGFIMLAGLARALFGLGRWAAFGGDPNNVYANMNAIRIRLTFFDINDSLLCMMACAIAAVVLFGSGQERPGLARPGLARPGPEGPRPVACAPAAAQHPLWRAIAWLTLMTTAACIVLSYRRSAWIGFMLGCAVVLLRFPPRRRVQLALAALPLAGGALAYAALRRLGQARGGGGLASLLYDMQSRRFGPESERVLELKLVLADILARPFTGIGAWGRYTGYQQISWQANPDGGLFLHSGILHVALKSGLPGVILLAGTVWAFVLAARRALRTLPPELLGLGTAGVAGAAFMIPDILIGTPFPQVRTTQMLAVALALPYVALAANSVPALPKRSAHLRLRPDVAPA